ncbi:ABC transporter substrate-binding protein [Chloroflexi bacterium TSY]|nr:ABC transporter substrate-binding protein [Chloroflexi bacterium TSY]
MIRHYLFSIVVILAQLLSACGSGAPSAAPAEQPEASDASEAPAEASDASTPADGAKEAPELAAMVEAGDLSPLDERLPLEPLVVPVVEEIGQYGGTWRRVFLGPSDAQNIERIQHDRFLEFDTDGFTIVPHVAKAWEISDDGTSFTFTLREGMKWSDGHPFTADDILFWYEDKILNDDLSPTKPSWMRIGGEVGVVEKVDDYTVRFSFAEPYPLILEFLAQQGHYGSQQVYLPKHYLSQFHPNYASEDELQQKLEDSGFEQWFQLFNQMADPNQNPDSPVVSGWMVESAITTQRMVLKRNPYYWKVDPEGNQLPYIDEITLDFVDNIEIANLRAIGGEVDMQGRHVLINNYPLLIDGAEQGDYRVLLWPNAGGTDAGLMFNQTYESDPVLGELLANKEFRIALSHAIDREEINESAFLGLGEARQLVPPPESPIYPGDEYAYKYIEYDADLANEMLDGVGLDQKDADGIRLTANGDQVTINIAAVPAFGPWVDVAELVASYWQDVGINALVDVQERSLHYERMRANELQVAIWNVGGAEHPFTYPYWTMPYANISRIGPLAGNWYQSAGESGVEPTGDLRRVTDLTEQGKGASAEERIEMGQEIFRLNADNLWTIGTVGLTPMVMGTVVVKNNFRNVPETAFNTVVVQTPGSARPEQFFIQQ